MGLSEALTFETMSNRSLVVQSNRSRPASAVFLNVSFLLPEMIFSRTQRMAGIRTYGEIY